MAWTLRALMGLSFGLGSLLLAGCDSGSSEGDTGTGNTATTTTGGGMLVGTPIPFADGWVPFDQNPFLIQGAFYTFADNEKDDDADGIFGTSTIMPASFAGTGARVCATGTAGQVGKNADDSDAYEDFWGAAIGLNLKQEENSDEVLPFDATAAGLTGFSFNIESSTAGASPIPDGFELRFNIKVAGDTNNYCKQITAAGVNTFKFTEMLQSCWDAEQITPDPTKLEAIHWQYVTKTTGSYDFDICITALAGTTD